MTQAPADAGGCGEGRAAGQTVLRTVSAGGARRFRRIRNGLRPEYLRLAGANTESKGETDMAKHEFGIMPMAPVPGQRFDEYEPRKYRCIPVRDEEIERLMPEISTLEMYRHTVDCPGRGLCYTGITLIPPAVLPRLREEVQRQGGMAELAALLRRAERESRWVIHYGI